MLMTLMSTLGDNLLMNLMPVGECLLVTLMTIGEDLLMAHYVDTDDHCDKTVLCSHLDVSSPTDNEEIDILCRVYYDHNKYS